MRSSMMGFEVQKRSIQMAQKALDITGHNLGNIGTAGYTRQRIDTSSLSISSFTYWQTKLSRLSLAGQGVTAFGVSQIRNDYLDKRYRDMTPFAAEYDVKMKITQEIETVLDNINTPGAGNLGLLSAMDKLKAALQKVAVDKPDAKDLTSLVRNEAKNICSMIRAYRVDLERLLENNLVELKDTISEANKIIDKIVDYNKAIKAEYITDAGRIHRGQGVSEYGPLEMLDKRNLLLDELSQYGNIEVTLNNNGSVKVTMAGVVIIDDEMSEKIVMQNYDDYNAAVLNFSNGEKFAPKNGLIKAYADMVSGNGPYMTGEFQNSEYGIPYYIQAIDAFAEGFAGLMNSVNKGELTDIDMWGRNLIWSGYDYCRYEIDLAGMVPPPSAANPVVLDLTIGNVEHTITFDGTLPDLYKNLEERGIEATLKLEGGKIVVISTDAVKPMKISAQNTDVTIEGEVVKARVTAENICVSDEWLANELLIAQVFHPDPIPAHNIFDFNVGSLLAGNYTMDISVNGVIVPITFNILAGDTADDKFNKFQNALIAAGVTNTVTVRNNGGTVTLIAKDLNDDFDVTSADLTVNKTEVPEFEGGWHVANLDGSNLHRFVRALEDARGWGRVYDFTGSAFEYLAFVSNRLAQGIEYLEHQYDATMDSINTLLDNRDAISSVSESEEGINMLTYEKWFNASSRLMTTLDDALDTVINRMGRVGLS